MKSLVIGNSSQLSFYFPDNVDKISSRNIEYSILQKKKYDNIFLLFSEQRTFLNESEEFYCNINVKYTLEVIDHLIDHSGKIYVFSTSELWNKYHGPVDLSLKFDYYYSSYIKSKHILCDFINEHREKYNNVKIIYPFNFNSPYRKQGFLFSKIFESIIHKKKIEVGDLNFKRDMIHPEILVKNLFNLDEDSILGTGELINVNIFIQNLFDKFDLDFNNLVIQNKNSYFGKRNEYYSKIKFSDFSELLKMTYRDIENYISGKRHN